MAEPRQGKPTASSHDRGHEGPQSVAGDAAILRASRSRSSADFLAGRPIDWGWRTYVPSGSAGVAGHFVAGVEPDGLCACVSSTA